MAATIGALASRGEARMLRHFPQRSYMLPARIPVRQRRLADAIMLTSAAAGVALSVTWSSAQALDASDTMAAWRSASSDARSEFVSGLLKRDGLEGSSSRVVQCLDAAAAVPGHADLLIREVVEACEKQIGDPV